MSITKKIFFASLIIFITILLFWGIYVLSFKKNTESNIAASNPSSLSLDMDERISIFSEENISFPVLSQDGSFIQYYSPESGKLSQLSLDGKNGPNLSSKGWQGASGVFWSPGKNKAILKFPGSEGHPYFLYLDSKDIRETRLKENLDTVVWQNDGKILYKYYSPETKERSLSISDPDGNNWKKITDLEFKNISIAPVPKTSFITYWNQGNAQEETQLISISIIGNDKKTLFKSKFGADYLWNNDGSKILLSHSNAKNGDKMELAILDEKGENYRGLEIPTFLSKCVWSSDNKTVYYALPGNIPAGSVLPDDYNANKFNTADTFWKIDTASGKKERILELNKIKGQIDAKNLFLSEDEGFLFFINKMDGKLYRVVL